MQVFMISKKKNIVITIHARVILIIANPFSGRRLQTKVKMAKCIFGDKLENKTFQLFTCILFCFCFCEISFGRDLGTEYIL